MPTFHEPAVREFSLGQLLKIMSPALQSSVVIVAYLALFAGVGVVFLFANLLLGRFLRPANPHPEKLEIYECGEPTIGSSFVQFDLRFYVVALLFIIFDVEVAFFFPWATVFGKSMHLADEQLAVVQQDDAGAWGLTPAATGLYQEMGVRSPHLAPVKAGEETKAASTRAIREGAKKLAWFTVIDIIVFFAVLMVGFAYVWKRGDLDWVRAVSRERASRGDPEPADENEPALSA